MLENFANWLDQTSISTAIKNVLWLIPMLQSIHILAVAVVLSSVGMITLRIVGLAGARTSFSETVARYVPWIWSALIVCLATGSTLVIGEPQRTLLNLSFQAKMSILLLGVLAVAFVQRSAARRKSYWNSVPEDPSSAATNIDRRRQRVDTALKIAAIVTFFLFCAVAVAGRLIAYTQPQLQ